MKTVFYKVQRREVQETESEWDGHTSKSYPTGRTLTRWDLNQYKIVNDELVETWLDSFDTKEDAERVMASLDGSADKVKQAQESLDYLKGSADDLLQQIQLVADESFTKLGKMLNAHGKIVEEFARVRTENRIFFEAEGIDWRKFPKCNEDGSISVPYQYRKDSP